MFSPEDDSNLITRGWIYASIDSVILLVLTALSAIFYERGGGRIEQSLISLAAWSITPSPCKINEEGCMVSFTSNHQLHTVGSNSTHVDCTLKSHNDEEGKICNLMGDSPMYEREGVNLFSVIGVPFLLLSSQVISTAFSLIYIRNDSIDNSHNTASNVQKTLKKLALLMMVVYAVCFLFIQNSWKVPGNNLFLSELFLLFSIFTVGFFSSSTFSEHAKYQTMPMRNGEFVLTIPFLAAAVLVVSGSTSIHDIIISFFSVFFTNGFLLLLEMDKDSQKNNNKLWTVSTAQWGILINSWISVIPFLMHYSLVISALQAEETVYRPWVLASCVGVLLYELCYILSITVYNITIYTSQGKKFLVFIKYDDRDLLHSSYVFLHKVLDVLCVGCKGLIYFSIMGGALSFEK